MPRRAQIFHRPRRHCKTGRFLPTYERSSPPCILLPVPLAPEFSTFLYIPLAAKRVEGTFEERRSVPGFPKPMLSRGHFTLEGESLVWQTQTPFASLMKVTPEGVFLEAAGEKQALTAAEIPAVGRICTLLTSVMGGRFDALSDLFAVSAAQSEGRVHISANPKSPELAQVVKHIQAEAGSYLEKLTMTGPQGDETVVLFYNVTVER